MKKRMFYSELPDTIVALKSLLINKKFAIVVFEREQSSINLKTYSSRSMVAGEGKNFISINIENLKHGVVAEIIIYTNAQPGSFAVPVFKESCKGASVSFVDFQEKSIAFYYFNMQGKEVCLAFVIEDTENSIPLSDVYLNREE